MASKRPRLSDGQLWQDAELFPTPPWATRALFRHVLTDHLLQGQRRLIWEPCAGLGHIAAVIEERGHTVIATDLHRYDGAGVAVRQCNFLNADERDRHLRGARPDWVITNPPFGLAEQMLNAALLEAREGVAFLLRLQWMETQQRYMRIFSTPRAPTLVAQFAERVAMCEGGWDPRGSTATAYAWFVWRKGANGRVHHDVDWSRGEYRGRLIPPTCKATLSLPSDQKMANWHVPGFVPPSTLKKTGKAQQRMDFTAPELQQGTL
jgi:hypothetical protein